MEAPIADIEGCRAAHERLLASIEDIPATVARQPSLLPGWTVAHVLAHLAANAASTMRRIDGARVGDVVDQYPGGAQGRAAEIEAESRRPAAELVAGVAEWSGRVDEAFRSLPEECWARPVRSGNGAEHPLAELPFRRWREVEVHLVDLGLGVTADAWTDGFVERELHMQLANLTGRADARSLVAWMLGRQPAPDLAPWG